MNYIKRDIEDVILSVNDEYPILLVCGPRQVGKTTMLEKLMEGTNRNYVSLDDLNTRQMAKQDPELFFQIHKLPIFIDEVQYAPELFPYMKQLVDRNKQVGQIWLSGSQLFKMMKGVQESLAGRVAILNLHSLSQNEIYTKQKNQPFKIDVNTIVKRGDEITSIGILEVFDRIHRGSMPAICSHAISNPSIYYSSYLTTYIDRDIRELSGAIDSLAFLNFITAVAARIGQMINYNSIAEEVNCTLQTVKNWLTILETLGIIYFLHPYSNNQLKRTIKTPKLFFYDTGLAAYLTKWSDGETLANGAMSGAFFENYVISEIIKSYDNAGVRPYFYYYRDRDSNEIDYVMEYDGELHPIEIKKAARIDESMIKAFQQLDKASIPRGQGAVICNASNLSALHDKCMIIPVSYL